MSRFLSVYDTCTGAPFKLEPIKDQLRRGWAAGALKAVVWTPPQWEGEFEFGLVQGGDAFSDVITYFRHPLRLQLERGREVTFLDVRDYGRYQAAQAQFAVRNPVELNWQLMRAGLEALWRSQRPALLADLSPLPMTVYQRLISESVARKYVLDPGEKAVVQVLAAYFYAGLFNDDATFSEVERERLYGKIAQVTRVPLAKVVEVIDELPVLRDLRALCEACVTQSVGGRLDGFNLGMLLTLVGGSWFGHNARENLCAALEHVPTWIMIVYSAITEATFKRSVLAKLIQDHTKAGVGDAFLQGLERVLLPQQLLTSFGFNERPF